mgnify:CR=1 FL=1
MAVLLGLSLMLVPLALCSGQAGEESTRLGLLVDAADSIPADVLAAFRQETERVLPLKLVSIHWRRMRRQNESESFDRLIVVRLVGECKPWQEPSPVPIGPLGVTHISDGRILPFVEADCGRVISAAQRLRRHPFRLGAEELGRALGRVIAHEIYHVLSASSVHDEQGLSKSALSAAELFLPGAGFAPAALERMASGLPRRTLQAVAAPLPPESN